jgi:hypothetical protein
MRKSGGSIFLLLNERSCRSRNVDIGSNPDESLKNHTSDLIRRGDSNAFLQHGIITACNSRSSDITKMTMAIGSPIWPVVMDNTYGISLHSPIALGYSPFPDESGIWAPL